MKPRHVVVVLVAVSLFGCKTEEEKKCEKDCVSVLAGSGLAKFVDGKAIAKEDGASFQMPRGIALASDGTLYVADAANRRVRVLRDGMVSTLAGSGEDGKKDGPAATATFSVPVAVAVDKAGAVYVADRGNHTVRKIVGGVVSTVAGTGTCGAANGPVATATLCQPVGIAIDPKSGAVIVAEWQNHDIRSIAKGAVTTLAGTGKPGYVDGPAAAAQFNNPHGVAVRDDGSILIADCANHRIRALSGGKVTTLAGVAQEKDKVVVKDGVFAEAGFRAPSAIAIGAKGEIYVVEWLGRALRVLRDGKVTTLAGPTGDESGARGNTDGAGDKVRFASPFGVAAAADGRVFVADTGNQLIRQYRPGPAPKEDTKKK